MTPEVRALADWSCTAVPAGSAADPRALDAAAPEWLPITVPGTAAAALAAASRWQLGRPHDFDAEDWWFRTSIDGLATPDDGGWTLVLDGLATLGDVWLDGDHLGSTANMFRRHELALPPVADGPHDLVIRCAALAPRLAEKRRPRPRWKARLPADQSLRWFRTTLFGRSPAWTPDVAPVGPWRPVTLQRRPAVDVRDAGRSTRLDGATGIVEAWCTVVPADATAALDLVVGSDRAAFVPDPDRPGHHRARLTVADPDLWWPATHGPQPRTPARVEGTVAAEARSVDLGPVSFRTVEMERSDAPVLRWNGEPLFVRGVCWAPLDPITLGSDPAALRSALEQVRDAGMNMVRVQGSFVPETDEFHDLCDELGLLVWQDLMFATLDYPADDPEFQAEVVAELADAFRGLARHPSTAVVCGGSEVLQQAAMLGRWGDGATDLLFEKLVPEQLASWLPDVPYWPGSPTWSGQAFSVDSGVAHYFGVGGYLRPLTDARTSGVRFASECLAFSHVPGDDSVATLRAEGIHVGDGAWKAAVPRDAGRAWDFEDVRDHYVRERFGLDPAGVRAVDPDRYLDLGRAAIAEVVSRTLAEWRRADSPCQGALLLQARDLVGGAGFGLVDVAGRPKSGWFALARVLRPVALLAVDEGLNGLDLHAVNDTATPVSGTLVVKAFAGPNVVADGEVACTVAPRGSARFRADAVLGGFLDLTYAYRFGPRSIDAVSATWADDDGTIAHTVFLPDGASAEPRDIGLSATVRAVDGHTSELVVSTVLAARCVLVEGRGARPSDDAFDLEPGGRAVVTVGHDGPVRLGVRAVNAVHPVSAQVSDG